MEKQLKTLLFTTLVCTSSAFIQILHPQELRNKLGSDGYIKSSLGNFGHIVYGSTILGRLHYPINNRKACNEFSENDFKNDFLFDEDSDLSPIVIVDRGECLFTTKVRNIEKLGVKLAIIVDDQEEYTENLIMADEGSGHSINIPSFIVRKKDGNIIKDTLINNPSKTVYLKAELEMVHPDNRVEYELWYSSVLDLDYMQVKDLASYQFALGKNALFTPRILTYNCKDCSEEVKKNSCVANGLYCPYLPKNDVPQTLKEVKEVALIEESLRQKCIYQTLAEESNVNSNFTKWFNYLLNFIDTCNVDSKSFTEQCSKNVMKEVGIDGDKVDQCIKNSYEKSGFGQTPSDNKLLKEDRRWSGQLGIILHPQVSINNITYRGDFNGYDIFRAICAGFKDQPEICKGDNIFYAIENEDNQFTVSGRRHLAKATHIVLAVLLVIVLNLCALCLYRRYSKKKMNEELAVQVNSAVSQYFKLSGQDSSRDYN